MLRFIQKTEKRRMLGDLWGGWPSPSEKEQRRRRRSRCTDSTTENTEGQEGKEPANQRRPSVSSDRMDSG